MGEGVRPTPAIGPSSFFSNFLLPVAGVSLRLFKFRAPEAEGRNWTMITGELRSKVDRIWDTMWSGGISNPLSVIEQFTYLLFIKRLDQRFGSRQS